LPLCGKSLDIHWLLSRGYRIRGAELSKIAVDSYSRAWRPAGDSAIGQMTVTPRQISTFRRRHLQPVGRRTRPVDAIYDRAAMIALPNRRSRYAAHLMSITGRVPQLLVTLTMTRALPTGRLFQSPRRKSAGITRPITI